MTRRWLPGVKRETGVAWEWVCDKPGCASRSPEIARREGDLPSMDEMRSRGWYIAKTWGDLCPDCQGPRDAAV